MAPAHPDVLRAIGVTAELTGREFSEVAVRVMAQDLAAYPVPAVLEALARCRAEVSAPLTLAHVMARLTDGRPGADEAWGIALDSLDERHTVITTPEIIEALAKARPVLDVGDEVGARMAFKEAYARIVAQARAEGRAVAWQASLGWDVDLRVAALREGVRAGRLAAPKAVAMLPRPPKVGGKDEPPATPEDIQRMREALAQLKPASAKVREALAARAAAERERLALAKQATAEKVRDFAGGGA